VADLLREDGLSTPDVTADKQDFHAVNSLAAVFDLAYNPRLVGEELKQLIQDVRCSPAVQLQSKTPTGDTATDPQPSGVLALGDHRGSKLQLHCEPPDDPFKAILLGDILRIGRAALELERAREAERSRAALWPADPVEDQGDAIFIAEEMQSLLATVRRIATTTVPVLITGETGTGKEVLARTIHACSNRASSTFLPFNCASTPKDMLDSQLFGHRRGAFTGAVEHFQGVIRAAAGGTLFLDEIGDTGLDVQPKLLRFLEAGEVHPIGETQPARVDVRVIAATNADLDNLVRDGRFREDLFYRLSIVRLHVPPLRERRVEIPSLANHYLRKHAGEYRKGDLRLSEDTMEYLMLYKWPGNVRQLANEMRRLAALADTSAVLMPEHLTPEITASRRTVPASERTLDPTEVVVRLDQPMAAAVHHLEQVMVQYAMKKCDGRIEDTAKMLGLSRKGLYLKRQRFGIEPPEPAVSISA
jgi:DNA-binding NtrC family response regulator